DESVRMVVLGDSHGLLEITGRPDLYRLHLHAQRAGGVLSIPQERLPIGLRRVPQDGEVRKPRDALLEQFKPLSAELRIDRTQSRDIPAWPGQGGNESSPDRIVVDGHHDGNRRRRLSGHASRLWTPCHGDVDTRKHQLGGRLSRLFELAVSPAVLDHDVPALDVAEIVKTLLQSL